MTNTETPPVEPTKALASMDLVDLLAGLDPQDPRNRHKLEWFVAEAKKTKERAKVVERNAFITDLKGACEKQAIRIEEFCDTLDNMLGQGMAGPDAPQKLKKLGLNIPHLHDISHAADAVQGEFEAWHDRVKAIELAEVD